MRKKIVAIVTVLLLCVMFLGLFLTLKEWGRGILPGDIEVATYLSDPRPEGGYNMSRVTTEILCDGKLLEGDSGKFQVTSGQHVISFGNYSSEYKTPSEQDVTIKPYETTYVTTTYVANYGYLVIDTAIHNNYYMNTTNLQAEKYVDGKAAGSGHVCIKMNSSDIGNHIISFSEISGYTKPTDQVITISEGETKQVNGTYEAILTPEQEVYVFCRRYVGGYSGELNSTSNIDYDQFMKSIRDQRITTAKCFIDKPYSVWGENWDGKAQLTYYIARYSGIYQTDRINAAADMYNKLNSSGVDLRQMTSVMSEMHYKDDAEYIIVAKLEFQIGYIAGENDFYQFNVTDIDDLPQLSSQVEIAGIGISFYPARQVYVTTNSSTLPFEEVYVPPFSTYTNLKEHNLGWYWAKQFAPQYSYDPQEFLKSLRIQRYY